MPRKTPRVVLAFTVLAALVAVNAFLFGGRLSRWATDGLAPAAARLGPARAFMAGVFRRGDRAENIRLTEELERLRAQVAGIEELKRDVEFYRAAADLALPIASEPVVAAVFSYPRAGGTREAIINKGSRDWVAPGDIVITATGALVGVVRESFNEHAVVLTLGDPALEVTGRVLGTEITGLVRADAEGLVLDLVARDETVSEGQVVVTSGNDRFPPALVLGTIRSVDTQQTTLFTVVRLTPSAPQPMADRVLIIRP